MLEDFCASGDRAAEAGGEDGFESSEHFEGARDGKSFKLGPKGVGYYNDHPFIPLESRCLTREDRGKVARAVKQLHDEFQSDPDACALAGRHGAVRWRELSL